MNDRRTYFNLIEPDSWLQPFFDHPPAGFEAKLGGGGLPLFKTGFDLLTTLDPSLRDRLRRAPGFKYWAGIINRSACFLGTTITEYAPIPQGTGGAVPRLSNGGVNTARPGLVGIAASSSSYMEPESLLREMLREAGDSSLAIVKDLPSDSPLLTPQDNEYSQKLVEAGLEHGFFELSGQALAYVPLDFTDIGEYLGRLSGSRRKDLRRKMKSADKLSVEVLELGCEFFTEPEALSELYEMYLEVFRQSEIHFDLLSAEFFKTLLSGRAAPGVVILYRHHGDLVGYNICLIHRDCLIDKYIGFRYPQARQLNLYFVSWLYNLELALKRGLKFYVAGWTDPEVKASLGAQFTFTRHLVWIRNPLLRRVMRPLRQLFEADKKTMGSL